MRARRDMKGIRVRECVYVRAVAYLSVVILVLLYLFPSKNAIAECCKRTSNPSRYPFRTRTPRNNAARKKEKKKLVVFIQGSLVLRVLLFIGSGVVLFSSSCAGFVLLCWPSGRSLFFPCFILRRMLC